MYRYTHTYMYRYTRAHTHTHTHTRTSTGTHTRTHTHAQARESPFLPGAREQIQPPGAFRKRGVAARADEQSRLSVSIHGHVRIIFHLRPKHGVKRCTLVKDEISDELRLENKRGGENKSAGFPPPHL